MRRKLYALALLLAGFTTGAQAQNTPANQMEKLTRGVLSLPASSGTGRFVSWRFFGTDPDETTFDLLRDGTKIASDIFDKTNYVDKTGFTNSVYTVVTKVKGVEVDRSEDCEIFADNDYRTLQLDRPADGKTPSGDTYTYSPNDCSVGDVDGDGQYELFVKWDPDNSKDNSQSGYTGNVFIDCYKMDGTKLWRIDLGVNIRAGAHYTQYLVYDFDGDGKVEMMLKTGPGSKDATDTYVSEVADEDEIKTVSNTKDWRNTSGKVTGGQEWLTVFDGMTGKAIHTVFYRPNRAPNSDGSPNWGGAPSWTYNWGADAGKSDTEYGNRGERYLAAVAYLDGPDATPSAVFSRGYYQQAYIWAVDFDGSKISTRWLSASTSKTKMIRYDANGNSESKTYTKCTSGTGSRTMYGNGNHNLSIADVDGDGCDEIIWGSAALNNDGWLLYATGYGHGDAIHLSDLVPQRPGLEVFQVHEESPYGWDLHDAATGEIIYSAISDGDNGRGMAADIEVDYEGCEFWSAAKDGTHAVTNGSAIYAGQGATNFRIYWDGDLQEELFDGNYSTTNGGCTPKVTKMSNGVASEIARLTATSARTCNTTKATPCLQADIFGDWREEVLLWNGEDPSQIFIFAANSETTYRIPTLMHDHVYRMGVAWQNVAYNQPPHLGYYLPASFTTRYALMGEGAMEQTVNVGDSIKTIVLKWVNCAAPSLTKWTDPTGTSKVTGSPEGFTLVGDIYLNKTITLTGAPTMAGDYEFILKSGKNIIDETQQYDTIRIHAISTDGIDGVKTNANPEEWVKLGKSSFNNSIVLTFNLNEAQDVKIGLYSMAGAQVADVTHLAVNQAPFEIYGLNRLPAGIYLLKVESKEGKFTQKLLKR